MTGGRVQFGLLTRSLAAKELTLLLIPRAFAALTLCAALAVPSIAQTPKPTTTPNTTAAQDSQISASERAFIASKIYAAIPLYFAHWQGAPNLDLDAAYRRYLDAALAAPDRYGFDLATMEFMAGLHNGHTGFSDDWLQENYRQPLGFRARCLDGQWVVTQSIVPGLKPGQVIAALDGTPFETFFQRKEKYLAQSNDRTTRRSLFNHAELFPLRFTLTMADGVKTTIDRRTQKNFLDRKVEGRWIQENSVAYVSIPSFAGAQYEQAALAYVKQFQSAKTLIIDVRGNGGGSTPGDLTDALSDRPYRFWAEASPMNVGIFNERAQEARQQPKDGPGSEEIKGYYEAYTEIANRPMVCWPASSNTPEHPLYKGKLLLLTDGGCFSACEDFLVPFKDNKRGTLIGETTGGSSGQSFHYDFGNGMSFHVSTKREFFPDGSLFEGIGIRPDIEVTPTVADLAAGRDPVLAKALEIAALP